MTNEAKSTYIATEITKSIGSTMSLFPQVYKSAMEMADWKEAQVKAEIDALIAEQNPNGTADDDAVLDALKSLKQRLNLE